MKEEFLAYTDYQNQKRYREDEYYLNCLVQHRDSLLRDLEETIA